MRGGGGWSVVHESKAGTGAGGLKGGAQVGRESQQAPVSLHENATGV